MRVSGIVVHQRDRHGCMRITQETGDRIVQSEWLAEKDLGFRILLQDNIRSQSTHQKKSTFLTTSNYILLHLIPLILGVRKE